MLWPICQNQLILTMELGDYEEYASVKGIFWAEKQGWFP